MSTAPNAEQWAEDRCTSPAELEEARAEGERARGIAARIAALLPPREGS